MARGSRASSSYLEVGDQKRMRLPGEGDGDMPADADVTDGNHGLSLRETAGTPVRRSRHDRNGRMTLSARIVLLIWERGGLGNSVAPKVYE